MFDKAKASSGISIEQKYPMIDVTETQLATGWTTESFVISPADAPRSSVLKRFPPAR